MGGWIYRTCPVCKGRGIIKSPDGKRYQLCPRCYGTGKIRVPVDDPTYIGDSWLQPKRYY